MSLRIQNWYCVAANTSVWMAWHSELEFEPNTNRYWLYLFLLIFNTEPRSFVLTRIHPSRLSRPRCAAASLSSATAALSGNAPDEQLPRRRPNAQPPSLASPLTRSQTHRRLPRHQRPAAPSSPSSASEFPFFLLPSSAPFFLPSGGVVLLPIRREQSWRRALGSSHPHG